MVIVFLLPVSAVIAGVVTPGQPGLPSDRAPNGWFETGFAWLIHGAGVIALLFVLWWFVRHGRNLARLGHRPMISPLGGITVLGVYYVCIPIVAGVVWYSIWGALAEGQVLDPATRAQRGLVYQVITLCSVVAWILVRRSAQNQEWTDRIKAYWSQIDGAAPVTERAGIRTCMRISLTALVVSWPVIVLSGNVCRVVSQWITGKEEGTLAHEVLQMLDQAPLDQVLPWLVMASVIFLAPIVEEVVYRGSLQATLRPAARSPWLSIVCAASLFGLMHVGSASWIAIPGLVFFGATLGYTYERTGRIITPIMTHVFFNLGNIAIFLISRGC